MPNLPQYNEDFPILGSVPIATKEKAYSAFEKTIDATSNALFKVGETLAQDASSSMYLQAQSHIADVESNSHIKMLQNPAESSTFQQDADQEIDAIKSNAALNKHDRRNLDYLADRSKNTIKLRAATENVKLSHEQARFALTSMFQNNLQSFMTALSSGDPKAAENQARAMHDAISGAVKTGILNAKQATAALKLIGEEQERAKMLHNAFIDGNTNAAEYHALTSFTPNGTINAASAPTNEHTNAIYDLNAQYTTVKDIRSGLAQGVNIPVANFVNVKGNTELSSLLQYRQGAALGNGIIYSGESYNNVIKEHTRLDKSPRLSEQDEGKRDRLKNYINDIENGNFLKYAAETQAGARALQEFNLELSSINQSQDKDDVKNARQIDARRHLYDKLFNVAESQHIPLQYRAIFPQSQVDDIKKSLFDPTMDMGSGLTAISQVKPDMLPLLANQMRDTEKGQTVYQVGYLQGKADPGFITDLVNSQRQQIETPDKKISKFQQLQTDKEGKSINKIKDAVNARITDITSMLVKQPTGAQQVSDLTKQAIKYVQYRAAKDNDVKLSNMDKYVDDFANNISRVYKPYSYYSGQLDLNVIQVNEADAKSLMSYALTKTHEKMHAYMNEAQFTDSISRNPISVMSLPTGHIVVVDNYGRSVRDKNGNPAFDYLFNQDMLRVAKSTKLLQMGEVKNTKNIFLNTNRRKTHLEFIPGGIE